MSAAWPVSGQNGDLALGREGCARACRRYVEAGVTDPPASPFRETFGGRVLGSADFGKGVRLGKMRGLVIFRGRVAGIGLVGTPSELRRRGPRSPSGERLRNSLDSFRTAPFNESCGVQPRSGTSRDSPMPRRLPPGPRSFVGFGQKPKLVRSLWTSSRLPLVNENRGAVAHERSRRGMVADATAEAGGQAAQMSHFRFTVRRLMIFVGVVVCLLFIGRFLAEALHDDPYLASGVIRRLDPGARARSPSTCLKATSGFCRARTIGFRPRSDHRSSLTSPRRLPTRHSGRSRHTSPRPGTASGSRSGET